MSAFAQYIYSVTIAAIMCTIVKNIPQSKSAGRAVVSTLCGIFLTITIISPLKDVTIRNMDEYILSFSEDSDLTVALGSEMRNENLKADIKQRTEAYILDKANALRAQLQVEVILSDDNALPVPVSVRLSGSISPYAKNQLQRILEDDLGISKENQIWN